MNDEQRKEIRQQFWDEDYFDGLPNKGELLKHFINEYGKAIERQQQAREDSLCSMVKEYQDKVDELRAEKEHVTGLNMLLKMQVNGLKSEIETLKKTNEELAEYIWKYESLLRAF
jgi:predicted RNase H-like nuclease (RuvC/YqgF family)